MISKANTVCPSLQYYDIYYQKCVDKMLNNQSCVVQMACRDDLGLSCQSGKCFCNQAIQYWNGSICTNLFTYNNQTCTSSNQCLTPMICNLAGNLCSCPQSASLNTCDCPTRKHGSEYYSIGITCVLASTYGGVCNGNYSCQYLTQNTFCNGTCQCDTNQYFNYADNMCENVLPFNSNCTQNDACNSTIGLSCLNNVCQCNSTQYWNVTSCVNYVPYGLGTCTSNYQCNSNLNLVCKLPSTLSCSCPKRVTNNKCDCPAPVYGIEYYWNGTSCVLSNTYNQTCTSASTNFMCQVVTQGTNCTGPAPFRCLCSSTQYFNYANNTCETLLSVYGICNQPDACDGALGLSCQNNQCQCNSTQFWNVTSCINLFSYAGGVCSSDNQCQKSLVCLTSGASCSCPWSIVYGYCDCPSRLVGSEYYWNGTNCVIAASFNQSCSSADYTCQYLTQNTYCNTTIGLCSCNSTSVWNGIQCVSCPSVGWILYRGSCFKQSSVTNQLYPQLLISSTIYSSCYLQPTARLAILSNSDFNNNFLSLANGLNASNEYWFDAYRSSDAAIIFYSQNKVYNVTYNPISWASPLMVGEWCATWKVDTKQLKSHTCSSANDKRPFLCEIVLVP